MEDILGKFQPGVLPHYFVVQTLASLSDSNGTYFALNTLRVMRFKLHVCSHWNSIWSTQTHLHDGFVLFDRFAHSFREALNVIVFTIRVSWRLCFSSSLNLMFTIPWYVRSVRPFYLPFTWPPYWKFKLCFEWLVSTCSLWHGAIPQRYLGYHVTYVRTGQARQHEVGFLLW